MAATLNVAFDPCGAGKTTYAHAFAIKVTPDLFDVIEGVYEPPEPAN